MNYRRLWVSLALVMIISFAILGYYGGRIYRVMPPIPDRVVTEDGTELFTAQDIKDGQNVWQSIGGQEVGSIWGHGAYVAPDWNADWLHRESMFILDKWGNADFGQNYDDLNVEQQAQLKARLKNEMRTNTYNPDTKEIVISNDRGDAYRYLSDYYTGLFMNDSNFNQLRDDYAIPINTIKHTERMRHMNSFFFWSTWATATNRPGSDITYTNNWPNEQLIDNKPTGEMVVWSVVSFVMLLAGVGALAWYFAVQRKKEPHMEEVYPERDPLLALSATPSMKATQKYFWVVAALWLVQILLGVITGHYEVEGNGFYGIPIEKWIPYSVVEHGIPS